MKKGCIYIDLRHGIRSIDPSFLKAIEEERISGALVVIESEEDIEEDRTKRIVVH